MYFALRRVLHKDFGGSVISILRPSPASSLTQGLPFLQWRRSYSSIDSLKKSGKAPPLSERLKPSLIYQHPMHKDKIVH